jgi:uncharacterized protein GlcG (DUF336 family)
MAISLEQTKAVLAAAERRAVELNVPSVIAVMDDAANLKGLLRMDETSILCLQAALGKAYTSAVWDGPTADLLDQCQPGQPLYGLQSWNNQLIIFGGGIPLRERGKLVGAVGVSGGTVEEDVVIAEAAVAGFEGG